MEEKNIMISLGDERIKEISEVIGNKSCNKILDFLSNNEATTSEIATKLKMPINTVDYNVKKLVKAGLIEKSSHWWSVKGKKMPTYKVSNKKIIISPKKKMTTTFLTALGITGFAAFFVKKLTETSTTQIARNEAFGAPAVAELATDSAAKAGTLVNDVIYQPGFFEGLSSANWFLIGAWLAIALFMLITLLNERRKK